MSNNNEEALKRFRRKTATRLRANATDPEQKSWRRLRRMNMKGSHFRRQVSIGPYVADFACLATRLLIELDGSQHGEIQNRLSDEKRTRWLEAEGYRVIRFWNSDLTENPQGVMETIHAAVYGAQERSHLKHKRSKDRNITRPGAFHAPTLPLQGRVKRSEIQCGIGSPEWI